MIERRIKAGLNAKFNSNTLTKRLEFFWGLLKVTSIPLHHPLAENHLNLVHRTGFTRRSRQLLREMVIDGVAHQFGIVVQVHLFQDATAVGADGFHAQGQIVGDLRNGFGRSEQHKYLVFAV